MHSEVNHICVLGRYKIAHTQLPTIAKKKAGLIQLKIPFWTNEVLEEYMGIWIIIE